MNYNLEERTSTFSGNLIDFLKKNQKNNFVFPLINQCLRAGTSIGANYMEANGASSKKDFKNKIYICKKEAKETTYWLKLIIKVIEEKDLIDNCDKLIKEAHELTLIFSKIAGSCSE